MKYELLIFDMDGTLFDYDQSERRALTDTALTLGLNVPGSELISRYRQFNKQVWDDYEKGLISQGQLKIKRFQLLKEYFNIKATPEELSRSYLEHLAKNGFLLENALDLIKELSREYKMALLTNGLSKIQHPRLEKAEVKDYFDPIIISEEVGTRKPAPDIFKVLFNRLTPPLEKKAALMIGDSLSSDIAGGISFGIDTCWYNPDKKRNPTSLKPTYEISSLTDMPHCL